MMVQQLMTKHPDTGEYEIALWVENYFERDMHAVEFHSDIGTLHKSPNHLGETLDSKNAQADETVPMEDFTLIQELDQALSSHIELDPVKLMEIMHSQNAINKITGKQLDLQFWATATNFVLILILALIVLILHI